MGWLSKKWKQIKGWFTPSDNVQAVNVEKKGTNQAIPIIYGYQKKTKTIKVFKATTDSPGASENDHLHLICVFCVGEIDSIGQIYFNDIPESQIDNERFYVERFTGSATQGYCTTLNNHFNQWKATAKLKNVAYAYVRLRQNNKVNWWNGEPEISADIKGLKVVDPRDGVTKYSENAALCAYDYLTNADYGKGLTANKINTNSFKAAADVIETDRTYTRTIYETFYDGESKTWIRRAVGTVNETVTENLMSCNVSLDAEKTLKQNVETLLGGMRAILPETNGQYRLAIEKDDAPVFAFTKDNLVGAIQCQGGNQSDRYNQVIIRFRNRLTGEDDEAVFPDDDGLHQLWKAEDNDKLLLGEFDFDTINNKAEALQMGHVIAYRSRNLIGAMFTGTPETIVVEAGDIVTINSTIFGWNAKPFRIESVDIDAIKSGECAFQAVEHQNNIYPWAITDVNEEYADTSFALPQNLDMPTGLIFEELAQPNKNQAKLIFDNANNTLVFEYELEIWQLDVQLNDYVLLSREISIETKIYLNDLPLGDYELRLSAINRLYQSPQAILPVTITIEPVGAVTTLNLYTDSAVFSVDNLGVITPDVITLTAQTNSDSTVVWSTQPVTVLSDVLDETDPLNPIVNSKIKTLTKEDFGDKTSLVVTVDVDGIIDKKTIVKLSAVTGALNGILSNERFIIAADADGNITGNFNGAGGTFSVYLGVQDVSSECTFAIATSTNATASIDPATGIYSVTALSADQGSIIFEATYDGTVISRGYTIAKVRQGQDGAQGAQGSQGIEGIPGSNGANGQTSYFHIAYADSADGSTNFNQNGGAYTGTYVDFNAVDSNNYTAYNWVLTRGLQGPTGNQGIPGSNGSNGQTSYLHIAYADSADGATNFNQVSGAYIGQYVDFVLTDSSNYTDYNWSLIRGADGAQGDTGANGERGSKHFYKSIAGSAWSNADAEAAIASDGLVKITRDQVTLYNVSASYAEVRFWDGAAWTTVAQVIDGNLLVNGTVGADKLIVSEIDLKQANWGLGVSIQIDGGILGSNGLLATRIYAEADASATGLHVKSTSQAYAAITTTGRIWAHGDIKSLFGTISAPNIKVGNYSVYHEGNPPLGYNNANWDTAFTWGDHASAGYAASGGNSSIGFSASTLRAYNRCYIYENIIPVNDGYCGITANRWKGVYAVTGSFIGTVYGAAFTLLSDSRVKINQALIQNASSKVNKLNGKTFNRTDLDGELDASIIAQDLIGVFDAALKPMQDDVLGTKYGVSPMALIGLLVQAHKEHTDEINLLKQQIAELTA